MADINIKASFTVASDGSLQAVGNQAKKASEGLEQTSKNSRTADRNLKGAAQASSNATKNFSKMAQGISGTLVPAYATLAANVFALTAVFEFFKRASDLENLKATQVAYAQSTGTAIQTMSGRLKEASKDMLGFKESAQATAMGLAKGFSSSQMEDMAEGALKVANALGRPFEDSFDRLVRGISKAEPELLDELGITLRLKTATEDYAASIGKSADSLTAAERSQAIYIATMKQLEKQTEGAVAAANPFVQLGNTFRDIINTITSGLLPVFKAIATFLNENAVAAFAFFALIGASIVKSFAPIDDMKAKFGSFVTAQNEKLDKARTGLKNYQNELKRTKETIAQTQARGSLGVQRGAAQALQAGSKSKMLQNIASGQANMYSGVTRANLQKALKAAEADFAKHGKITKGIFKGVGIEIVRSIGGSLTQSQVKAKTTTQKIGQYFSNLTLKAKILKSTIGVGLTKAMSSAGKAASFMGKAMNKAMTATFILGMIQMVYDLVMSIVNAPATMLEKATSVLGGFFKLVQGMANAIVSLLNAVIEKANKIPGINLEKIGKFEFGDKIATGLNAALKGSEVYKGAKDIETRRQKVLEANEAVEALRENTKTLAGELNLLLKAQNDPNKTIFEKSLAAAKTLQSLGLGSQLKDLLVATDGSPEARAKGLALLADKMKRIKEISPDMYEALQKGDLAAVQSIEMTLGAFTANIASIEDQISNLGSTLTAGTSALDAEILVKNMVNTGDAAVEAGAKFGLTTDILKQLDEAFANAGGAEAFLQNLTNIRTEMDAVKQRQHDLAVQGVMQSMAPGALGEQFGREREAQSASLALEMKQLQLREAQTMSTVNMNEAQRIQHEQRIKQLTNETEILEKQSAIAKRNATDIGRIGQTIADSLTSGLETAINGLIQGTLTLKQAFKQMAISMLQDLSKVITQMIVVNMLKAAFGGTEFGANFLGLSGPTSESYLPMQFSGGGIMDQGKKIPGYSTGGIASGSRQGYPAILHGTEAVVPLPNGKSIPVQMQGGAGQMNNVSVSVNVASDGKSDTNVSGDEGGMDLGKAIAQAVQEELQNQKRSGGILNPYGAA